MSRLRSCTAYGISPDFLPRPFAGVCQAPAVHPDGKVEQLQGEQEADRSSQSSKADKKDNEKAVSTKCLEAQESESG